MDLQDGGGKLPVFTFLGSDTSFDEEPSDQIEQQGTSEGYTVPDLTPPFSSIMPAFKIN